MNVCYANVATLFATFTNPRNRGPNFTWESFITNCENYADIWPQIADIRGNKTEVAELAKVFAKQIATSLVNEATK